MMTPSTDDLAARIAGHLHKALGTTTKASASAARLQRMRKTLEDLYDATGPQGLVELLGRLDPAPLADQVERYDSLAKGMHSVEHAHTAARLRGDSEAASLIRAMHRRGGEPLTKGWDGTAIPKLVDDGLSEGEIERRIAAAQRNGQGGEVDRLQRLAFVRSLQNAPRLDVRDVLAG